MSSKLTLLLGFLLSSIKSKQIFLWHELLLQTLHSFCFLFLIQRHSIIFYHPYLVLGRLTWFSCYSEFAVSLCRVMADLREECDSSSTSAFCSNWCCPCLVSQISWLLKICNSGQVGRPKHSWTLCSTVLILDFLFFKVRISKTEMPYSSFIILYD